MTSLRHSGFKGMIGVARRDITPPAGIYCRNWGAARHDAATGIHRPLTLTALSLQETNGSGRLVLIEADLGWFVDLCFANEFLRKIRESLDIHPEQCLFTLTHTHSAPPLLDQPEPGWQGGELLAPYHNKVQCTAIEAVHKAMESAEPALLEWHTGSCSLASNRDLPEGDRFLVGYNPDVPADDTLLVGRITLTDGRYLATLTNYACHPTTLAWDNSLISPDFVGAMRETVESQTGNAPALFLQGASGELAPREQYVGDPTVADRHGRQLGFSILATLADMNKPGHRFSFSEVVESGAPLALWKPEPNEPSLTLHAARIEVEVPLNNWPSSTDLEEQLQACNDRAIAERIRRKLRIRRAIGEKPTYSIPLHICQIGDAFLCGTMMECYSVIQQQLRSAFPDHAIVWVNLLNGSLGYLAPSDRYESDLYPIWQTPIGRGGFECISRAAHDAISRLVVDPAPK